MEPREQSFVEKGRGVDHVTVLTTGTTAASAYFTSLGFTVSPSKTSPGFENAVVYFADHTYIELFGITDRELVAKSTEAFALTAPFGITWNTLHVGSTEQTAAALRARQFEVWGPDSIPTKEDWAFKLGGLEKPAPGGRLFFIVYDEERSARARAKDPQKYVQRQSHANTALALHSIWIAARDLEAAVTTFEKLGFVVGAELDVPALRARGRAIAFANGSSLLILQGHDAASPVSTFLGTRNDAYMGTSIQVGELERARAAVASAGPSAAYDGLFGRSILVPATGDQNTWLELFERKAK